MLGLVTRLFPLDNRLLKDSMDLLQSGLSWKVLKSVGRGVGSEP